MSDILNVSDNIHFGRGENAVAADVGEDLVILSIDSGNLLQVNNIGARIWSLLEQPRNFAFICERLRQQFDVSAEVCSEHVTGFLTELRDNGVLKITSS